MSPTRAPVARTGALQPAPLGATHVSDPEFNFHSPAAQHQSHNACDDVSRGRECVRTALQMPLDSTERSSLLNQACTVGYAAACYFLAPDPKIDDDPVDYAKRACAFARKHACNKYADAVSYDNYAHEERWVTRVTRLTPEDPTSVEFIAHPGAKLLYLEAEGELAWALVMQFEISSDWSTGESESAPRDTINVNDPSPVLVRLPRAVLSKTEVPLREPEVQYNTRDFERTIFGSPDAADLRFTIPCGPIQIVAELPDHVQQLRQVKKGIEVRGFTREPIEWNWGTHTCWPRVTYGSRWNVPIKPSPEIPKGQIPLDKQEGHKAAQYVSAGTKMYQIWWGGSGLECAEVQYKPGILHIQPHSGTTVELTRHGTFNDSGFVTFTGGPRVVVDAQGIEHVSISVCESYLTLVHESPDAIEYVEDKELLAYHPDDVSRWYKTKAACSQAIAANPLERLASGKQTVAARLPLRLLGGC